MPIVYFLIAIVVLAPIVILCACAVLFVSSARVRFSGFKASRRQLRAWRRDRLEVPAPNRWRA